MDQQATCPMGIENRARIKSLEKDMGEVKEAITDMRDRLLGRPSWIVLFMFTAMSSTIVGLLFALLNHVGE